MEMKSTDKIQALIEKLHIMPMAIAKAFGVSRPTIYSWLRKGVPTPRHEEILDGLLQRHRQDKRPDFTEVEYSAFHNPFRVLIHDLKFTPEEVSRETGYNEITCLNWSFPSAKVSEFTKEKLFAGFSRFQRLREAEQGIDLLDQWCEERGFEKVPKKVDNANTQTYDKAIDPVFAARPPEETAPSATSNQSPLPVEAKGNNEPSQVVDSDQVPW